LLCTNFIPLIRINNNQEIYRRNSSNVFSTGWTRLPGEARDIGCGFAGQAAIIGSTTASGGSNPVPVGYKVYEWNGSNNWNVSSDGAGGATIDVFSTSLSQFVVSEIPSLRRVWTGR
jgi:hypothetical protein